MFSCNLTILTYIFLFLISTKCLQLQDLLHVEISNNENNKNATFCVHYIDKLPDNKWKHGQICLQAQMDSWMVER